ncbi:hypothetical protein HDU93_010056 [Gonapodya sp. JEL0774]|nr:hypothetical protein HDU93_010056 [Gonapodya sp. JEL0774]
MDEAYNSAPKSPNRSSDNLSVGHSRTRSNHSVPSRRPSTLSQAVPNNGAGTGDAKQFAGDKSKGEGKRTRSKVKALVADWAGGVEPASDGPGAGIPLNRSITWEDGKHGGPEDGDERASDRPRRARAESLESDRSSTNEDSERLRSDEEDSLTGDGDGLPRSRRPALGTTVSADGSYTQSEVEGSIQDPSFAMPPGLGGGGGVLGFPYYPSATFTDTEILRTGRGFLESGSDSYPERSTKFSAHGHSRQTKKELELQQKVNRLPMWRRDVRTFMRDHKSSRWAQIFNWIFISAVIISTFSMVILLSQRLELNDRSHAFFFVLEMVCGATFTLEIVLQVIGMATFQEALNWSFGIDLAATLPIWIELIYELSVGVNPLHNSTGISGLSTLRVLRLMRVFRLLRIAGKSGKIQLLLTALVESRNGILALIYALAVLVTFFATIIYYSEQTGEYYRDGYWYYHEDDSLSSFQSIPQCFWFVLVTLTTIGYGDVTPKTDLGKAVASVAIVASVFVIAFPLTMITFQFSHILRRWEAHEHAKQMRRRHMKLAAKEARNKLKSSGLQPKKKVKRRLSEMVQKVEKAVASISSKDGKPSRARAPFFDIVDGGSTTSSGSAQTPPATTPSNSSKAVLIGAAEQPSSQSVVETLQNDGSQLLASSTTSHQPEMSMSTETLGTDSVNALERTLLPASSDQSPVLNALNGVKPAERNRQESKPSVLKGFSIFSGGATRGTPLPTTSRDPVTLPVNGSVPLLHPTRGAPTQQEQTSEAQPLLALPSPRMTTPRSGIAPTSTPSSIIGFAPHLSIFTEQVPKQSSEPDLELADSLSEDADPANRTMTIAEQLLLTTKLAQAPSSSSDPLNASSPEPSATRVNRVDRPPPDALRRSRQASATDRNPRLLEPKHAESARENLSSAASRRRNTSFASRGVATINSTDDESSDSHSVRTPSHPFLHSRHMSLLLRNGSEFGRPPSTIEESILHDKSQTPRNPYHPSSSRDLASFNLPTQIPIPQLVAELRSHTPKHVELKVSTVHSLTNH